MVSRVFSATASLSFAAPLTLSHTIPLWFKQTTESTKGKPTNVVLYSKVMTIVMMNDEDDDEYDILDGDDELVVLLAMRSLG